MTATWCMLTCALCVTQSTERFPVSPAPAPLRKPVQNAPASEWQVTPQLSRGLELVYSGTFTEETLGPSVQFQRSYRLESTAFVYEPSRIAFLTVLRLRSNRPGEPNTPQAQPSSVRLELVECNRQGKLSAAAGVSLAVPLEGPPTCECGAIIELPQGRISAERTWEVVEAGRPPRTWRVAGTEPVNNTTCIKLIGQQQSDDWDKPRADHAAWRRSETVWLAPQLGVAYRVERVIERRDPA